MASSSSFRRPASSFGRGARYRPPTRRLTGWIGRPPTIVEDLVADPLQPQASLDGRPIELGELDGAREPEEVGRVEEVHVQGVALDPLPAVQKAAQRADLRVDLDAEQVLEGVDRGQLVGDGADPADPGDDVDDLVGRPADDQPLEEARRLEDPELSLDDLAVRTASGGCPRPRRG